MEPPPTPQEHSSRAGFPGGGHTGLDPGVQRLLAESRSRQVSEFSRPELRTEAIVAASFLLAATACALLLPSERSLQLPVALAAVLALAISARVEFHTGAGWTVPTQLVFVPMLFVLPTPCVPALVAAGLLLSKAAEYTRGEVRPERALLAFGDAWYSIGPAVVISLAGAEVPQWSDWPIYLAALGSQFAIDATISVLRARFGLGVPTLAHLRELRSVYLVDALLSPIGLLAGFASQEQSYAFLLVLPLAALLAVFARERQARIDSAVALSDAYRGTALLLGELISARDEYTGEHSRSVVILSIEVAERIGLSERQKREVEFAALLHDIGKISIPQEILHKAEPLTDQEFEVMKGHVTDGQLMLERIGGTLGQASYVVRTHHERFDGSGYPDGLAGEEIPLPARIIAACDAFNAMTTDRPYRPAMSIATAISTLRAAAGTQFDPVVVATLTELIEKSLQRIGGDPGKAPPPDEDWLEALRA
jgi:hypothetical protein